MPLTKQQFEELYSKGLSVDQIVAFERGETPETLEGRKGLKGVGTGIIKGAGQLIRNAGKFGQEVAQQTAGRVVNAALGRGFVATDDLGDPLFEGETPEFLKPKGTAEEIGFGAEKIAELAIPGGAVYKAARGANLVTRVAAEGLASGGVTALQEGDFDRNARDALIVGSIFPAAGAVLRSGKSIVKTKIGEKAAPRLINSLIKPLAKDFSYGKNPGRAVAEEGITANSLEDLAVKIGERRQFIGKAISEAISSPESSAKFIDFSDALKPLDDAIVAAQKSPRTNAGLINRLEDAKKDLLGVTTDQNGQEIVSRVLRGSPLAAFNMKQDVAAITKFTGNASDDAAVNKALKGVYGNLKSKIDEAVPGLRKLNERYADLSAAEIATKYRDVVAERLNLVSLPQNTIAVGSAIIGAITSGGTAIPTILAGAGGVAIQKAMASPRVKTRVAKWLVQASPEEKARVFEKAPFLKAALIRAYIGD